METKHVERMPTEQGGYTEVTSEALSSVEVGQDAKGTVYVKSVKVYDSSPMDAADKALVVLSHLMGLISDMPKKVPEGSKSKEVLW